MSLLSIIKNKILSIVRNASLNLQSLHTITQECQFVYAKTTFLTILIKAYGKNIKLPNNDNNSSKTKLS